MSYVYRDRRWLLCALLGFLVVTPALLVWLKVGQPPSWTVPTTLLGTLLVTRGSFLHDRSHRRQGAAPHAMKSSNLFRR